MDKKYHDKFKNYKNDFPFFKKHPQLVFLDSAATSLKPQIVINAITDYYQKYSINNHSQDYPLAVAGNNVVQKTREVVAQLINGDSDEVVFCPSATFAYNQIAQALTSYLQPGDEIIVSTFEHSSLLLPLYRLAQQTKAQIKFVQTNDEGVITPSALQKVLTPKTRIVAFASVNNSFGIINDTFTLTKFIKEYGKNHLRTNKKWFFANILVIIDGAQAIAHSKIDVKAWNIDFFAFSAHKVFGPTGIGVLWGKNEWLNRLEPLLLGGGMNGGFDLDSNFELLVSPYRFEGGTQNLAGIFGLRAAIMYLLDIGIENIIAHEVTLKKYALTQLKKHLRSKINIYNTSAHNGNIIFNITNIFAQDVASFLGTENICVRSGTYCARLLPYNIASAASVRISFSIYNNETDIDALIKALKKGLAGKGDFLNVFF